MKVFSLFFSSILMADTFKNKFHYLLSVNFTDFTFSYFVWNHLYEEKPRILRRLVKKKIDTSS